MSNEKILRPPSPMHLFIQHFKKNYIADPLDGIKEVGQQAGLVWANMNQEEKAVYVKIAEQKKIEFDILAEKNLAHDTAVKQSASDTEIKAAKAALDEAMEKFLQEIDPYKDDSPKSNSSSETGNQSSP